MLGLEELEKEIKKTKTTVQCPCKDCTEIVKRRRKGDKNDSRFICPKHMISISPSTFVYQNILENLLWNETQDKELLERIKKPKRENRMNHDNSEDAVSWNVFRFLEKNDLIKGFLNLITGHIQNSSQVIYWSYSQKENAEWSELNKAREEFGEEIMRSSEPDIIIKTDKALFFIEAKLLAGNKTDPTNEDNSKKYETGGNNWFSEVFKSDYKTVAIDEKKYELLRFWLLGSWIAKKLDLDFFLINLVLEKRELDIEQRFNVHINENSNRIFLRTTWETIYQFISRNGKESKDKATMIRYFKNKTVGYDIKGKIKKAFSIT